MATDLGATTHTKAGQASGWVAGASMPPSLILRAGALEVTGEVAARSTIAAAETANPAAGTQIYFPCSPLHHLALCPDSPHMRHLGRFLHRTMRCSGGRHLKHLPLAFLNSSSLKQDIGMALLSRGGGLFFPPTVYQPPSMAMKACPSFPPGLGEATPGTKTTDLSDKPEIWEESCSGEPTRQAPSRRP
jgi:hypothetical protein